MNKRTITVVLALILLACFFLPYFAIDDDKFSAFSIVFGDGKIAGASGAESYLWLLVPMGALLLILGGAKFTGGFAFWLPLLGLLYIVLRVFFEATIHNSAGDAAKLVFELASYGFWISLAAAVGIVLTRNRA